jgi:uncharacterized protein
MARRMTEKERQEFLAEPRIGVLSVARGGDRPPHSTPVWYAYEPGADLTFFRRDAGPEVPQGRAKAELVRKAGVLSLTVQRQEFPYGYVTVEGSVLGEDRPGPAERAFAVARRYLPEEAARGLVRAEIGHPAGELVLFTVRPERWLSFEFSEEGYRGTGLWQPREGELDEPSKGSVGGRVATRAK